jgi:hypothetical protein
MNTQQTFTASQTVMHHLQLAKIACIVQNNKSSSLVFQMELLKLLSDVKALEPSFLPAFTPEEKLPYHVSALFHTRIYNVQIILKSFMVLMKCTKLESFEVISSAKYLTTPFNILQLT